MPLDRVAGQPTWLLSRAHARAQGILFAGFAEAGVRGYHYRLMAALDQYGPSSQADLGRRTGIDRSDVVTALNELDEWGWTRRDPDPSDRRRNVVVITEVGVAWLEELDEVVAAAQKAVLAPLTKPEQAQLLRILTKLID